MEISSVYNKKKPFMLNIRVNVYVKVGEHEFFSCWGTQILHSWRKEESTWSTELLNLTKHELELPDLFTINVTGPTFPTSYSH